MANKHYNVRSVINFCAYVSLVLIAVSLVFVAIFKNKQGTFSNILEIVSQIIAYLVVIVTSFFYARSKRSIVFMCVWLIASVLVVVMFIIK